MKILILSRLPNLYSTQRLVQEALERGHAAIVEHPEFTETADADVVIPRIGQFNYFPKTLEIYTEFCRNSQAKILNPAKAFHQARHKGLSYQQLKQKNLPQPALLTPPFHFPLVIKECLGSKGEGVALCHSTQDISNFLALSPPGEFLYQEYIAESRGHDLRLFVIGDKVVAAMERFSADPEKEFRANLALGGYAKALQPTEEESQLALQATQILELDYAGVDILRSNRGPLILEVNPCPGLEGIEKYTQVNVSRKLIEYVEQNSLRPHSQR